MTDPKVTATPVPTAPMPNARSKVMDSWNSSWKSISKTPTIMPIVETPVARPTKANKTPKDDHQIVKVSPEAKRSPEVKRSPMVAKDTSEVKRLDAKENSVRSVTKVTLVNKSDVKTRDLRPKSTESNGDKVQNNNTNVSQKEDNRRDPKTGDKSDDNSVLSKLRKRKIDAKSPLISGENHKQLPTNSMAKPPEIPSQSEKTIAGPLVEPVQDPKETIEKQNELVDKQNELCTKERESAINKITIKEVNIEIRPKANDTSQPMDVSEPFVAEAGICMICGRKASRFSLFEERFCSSICAVKQWTIEFHKRWV